MADQTSEAEKQYQLQKYNEIVEMLLSAGYFRARIAALSEFDKVVGGLCWCITSSGEDLDVDILFQENSNIGQKIQLSESIINVLRKMGCPHPLQANQIQGGDFASIYPVIVWLVKKFFENREAKADQMRAFSKQQFAKVLHFPTERRRAEPTIGLQHILRQTKADRRYKRSDMGGSRRQTEETRVRACLLEYGEVFVASKGEEGGDAGQGNGGPGMKAVVVVTAEDDGINFSKIRADELSGFERQLAQAHKATLQEEEAIAKAAQAEASALFEQMKIVDSAVDKGQAVSGSQVGAIVSMQSDLISTAVAGYQTALEQTRKQLDESAAEGKLGKAAAFRRQRAGLQKQIEAKQATLTALEAQRQVVADKMALLNTERASALEYNNRIQEQVAKLAALEEQAEQKNELDSLKDLVALNESLKSQETDFKANCKRQLGLLQQQLADLDALQGTTDEESSRLQEIEDMHAKVTAKYDKLRQLLAQRNLEVARSVRIIDDVPSRTELIQYERRFVELYQQVAWKFEENRKYYDLYNTLDEQRNFLQKEVKLLNSISDTFDEALKSRASREEYLKQFENIIRGVEESLRKQSAKLEERVRQVNELKQSHQNLVDEQRRYYKAVKDFQEECVKNEWLVQQLEGTRS